MYGEGRMCDAQSLIPVEDNLAHFRNITPSA